MKAWEKTNAVIHSKRQLAALKLKDLLSGSISDEDLFSLMLPKRGYVPGDHADDLIELCSIIASIRYMQETYS